AAIMKRLQGLVIGDGDILRAAAVFQPSVLRPHTGVVQPGRNGVRLHDLTIFVLNDIRSVAMQYTDLPGVERGSVTAGFDTVAGSFNTYQLHAVVADVRVENTHGVGTATHRRQHIIWLPTYVFLHLLDAFGADNGLEVAHHGRVRVRPRHRANNVKRILDIGDPVAHGFIERIFKGARARIDRDHLGAQQLHSVYVLSLTANVFTAHVHHALKPVARRYSGRGHAVLTGAGFGNNARLAHATCQQNLANAVVDFVGTRVIKVFTLEPDLGTSELF